MKPELLEDAVTAGLSETAFRLFVGLILLADDYGVVRTEPAYLVGQIFWKVPPTVPIDTAIVEVGKRLVQMYEHGGQVYGFIRNWEKHQKVSHRGKRRLPAPPEGLTNSSGGSHEFLRPDLRPSTIDQREIPSESSEILSPTPDSRDPGSARAHEEQEAIPDPMGESLIGGAWRDGVASVTGKAPARLVGRPLRAVLDVLGTGQPQTLETRCKAAYELGHDYAEACQGDILNAFKCADWHSSGRPKKKDYRRPHEIRQQPAKAGERSWLDDLSPEAQEALDYKPAKVIND